MGRSHRTVVRSVVWVVTGALLVAMAASAAVAAVPAKGGKLPKDACALLTESDVTELVPSASADAVNVTKTTIGCLWQDPQPAPGVLDNLTVSVVRLPAPPAQIKTSMQADAKKAGADPISGLGDFAFQDSRIPVTTEVAVLKGKLLVSLQFSGGEPVTDEQVATTLALAKKVVKQV